MKEFYVDHPVGESSIQIFKRRCFTREVPNLKNNVISSDLIWKNFKEEKIVAFNQRYHAKQEKSG